MMDWEEGWPGREGEDAFPSVSRSTLVDGVYERLRVAIVGGGIGPGSELSQVGLSREFGISRGPVREALQRLQAERLVQVNPYQQYVVSSLSSEVVEELFELREELEVVAVRRRLRASDRAWVASARNTNKGLTREAAGDNWIELDRELHRHLCDPLTEACALIEGIRSRVQHYLSSVANGPERQEQAWQEHEAIFDAIEEGNGARVEQALRRHIRNTRDVLLEAMAHLPGPAATDEVASA